jgi:predicted ATPase
MRLSTVAPIRGLSIPSLTGMTSQFYSILLSLRGRSRKYAKICDKFTDILGGKVEIVSEEGEEYRRLLYVLESDIRRIDLNLKYTSSMIKEITPIYLVIQELGSNNTCVIIEEPESHLHPSNQVKIIDIFTELVNNGLNIVVTTHSDLIIRRISNLLGNYYIKGEGLKLDPKITNIYYLHEDLGGSILNNIKIPEYGILDSLPTFEEIINNLYNDEIKIQQKFPLE